MNSKQRKEKLRQARIHSGYYFKKFVVGKLYKVKDKKTCAVYSDYNLFLGMYLEYLGDGAFASKELIGHNGSSKIKNFPDKYKNHCIFLGRYAFGF